MSEKYFEINSSQFPLSDQFLAHEIQDNFCQEQGEDEAELFFTSNLLVFLELILISFEN